MAGPCTPDPETGCESLGTTDDAKFVRVEDSACCEKNLENIEGAAGILVSRPDGGGAHIVEWQDSPCIPVDEVELAENGRQTHLLSSYGAAGCWKRIVGPPGSALTPMAMVWRGSVIGWRLEEIASGTACWDSDDIGEYEYDPESECEIVYAYWMTGCGEDPGNACLVRGDCLWLTGCACFMSNDGAGFGEPTGGKQRVVVEDLVTAPLSGDVDTCLKAIPEGDEDDVLTQNADGTVAWKPASGSGSSAVKCAFVHEESNPVGTQTYPNSARQNGQYISIVDPTASQDPDGIISGTIVIGSGNALLVAEGGYYKIDWACSFCEPGVPEGVPYITAGLHLYRYQPGTAILCRGADTTISLKADEVIEEYEVLLDIPFAFSGTWFGRLEEGYAIAFRLWSDVSSTALGCRAAHATITKIRS